MRKVTAIGCSSKRWRDVYYVNERVQRVLDKDPPLRRLLERKLTEHGRKLPAIVTLNRPIYTIVWKSVRHYDDDTTAVRAIVITTMCLPDRRLMTRVTSERERFPSHGGRG